MFHTDKFVLIFLLNIFIRPDNETKVTRYSICNSRKIYFVWLLNVCAKRKVEKTEQLVRSPWLFMCFHVGKGVLVLSALMILFLTISSFFFFFFTIWSCKGRWKARKSNFFFLFLSMCTLLLQKNIGLNTNVAVVDETKAGL